MNYFLSFLGALFFIFRIWIAEFKLKDELLFRRHYLSRVVNYHLCFAIILGFENSIFNSIVMTTFPVMILTTVWDYNFYSNFNKRTYWHKNKEWLLVERLTLHPPILMIGLWMYLSGGFIAFIPAEESFFPYIIAMLLVYVPFFIFDERWNSRYNWPQALIMIVLMISSTIIITLIGLFLIYNIDFTKIF